jgi:tetratricopeptide (TPR) repeat protein
MLNFAYGCFVASISRALAARHGLIAVAVGVGLCTGSALAQTQPAAEPAPTTAPATQPAQVVPPAALDAIAAGRYAEAATLLEPLARENSASFDVLAKYGGCLERLATEAANDRTKEGRDRFNKYTEEAANVFLRASRLGIDAGDSHAETLLRRVLVLKPRHGPALKLLGRMYARSGSALLATAQYREYIKTTEGENDYEIKIELARLLRDQKLWRQSAELLEKIRKTAGPDADQELALSYMAGGQSQKAMETAEEAVKNQQHAPDAHFIQASILLQLGAQSDPQKAVEGALAGVSQALEKLAKDPADEQTWQKFSGWRQWAATIAEALKRQARTAGLEPAVWGRLAKLIDGVNEMTRLLGAYDAASVMLNATRAENAPVELLVDLAQRQRDLGQAAAAVKTAERILARDSSNAIARKIRDNAAKMEGK